VGCDSQMKIWYICALAEFLAEYTRLLGCSLSLKFDNLTHYPRIIATVGPLHHMWVMRCEAKHAELKKVALDLISELPRDHKYSLYFDNLFTSLPLLDQLSAEGIGATGTLRMNRTKNAPLKNPRSYISQNYFVEIYDDDDMDYYLTESDTEDNVGGQSGYDGDVSFSTEYTLGSDSLDSGFRCSPESPRYSLESSHRTITVLKLRSIQIVQFSHHIQS